MGILITYICRIYNEQLFGNKQYYVSKCFQKWFIAPPLRKCGFSSAFNLTPDIYRRGKVGCGGHGKGGIYRRGGFIGVHVSGRGACPNCFSWDDVFDY